MNSGIQEQDPEINAKARRRQDAKKSTNSNGFFPIVSIFSAASRLGVEDFRYFLILLWCFLV